jgi:hypothetical protein
MNRGRIVAKYGARRHTMRAKSQRPSREALCLCQARKVGPIEVLSVMVSQSIG